MALLPGAFIPAGTRELVPLAHVELILPSHSHLPGGAAQRALLGWRVWGAGGGEVLLLDNLQPGM